MVSDGSGAVVPGATVEVTDQATGFTRNAVTELDGVYTIPLLNPGVYEAKASLAGFRTTVQSGVEVVVNGTARVDLKLQMESVAEQVTVEGTSRSWSKPRTPPSVSSSTRRKSSTCR